MRSWLHPCQLLVQSGVERGGLGSPYKGHPQVALLGSVLRDARHGVRQAEYFFPLKHATRLAVYFGLQRVRVYYLPDTV